MRLRLPAILPAAAATATVAATAAARTAIRFGTRFVDIQGSAVQIPAVQTVNRRIRFRIAAHFHESEASSLPCVAVRDDIYTLDGAVRFKHGTNRLFGRSETEISNKNVLHVFSFCICRAANR